MADLSNAVEKLKQIMSTEEGQAGIQNLVSNLTSGGGGDMSGLAALLGNTGGSNNAERDFNNSEPVDNAGNSGGFDNSSGFGNIDMDTMLKMQKMFSMMNSGGGNSRHTAVLQSIKPYLSEGRKGKLDAASKLMSIAKLAPLMKEL